VFYLYENLGKRDGVLTLQTNDMMAAIALSKSISYSFSLNHNTSVISLTSPSVLTQNRPRLLSLLQ